MYHICYNARFKVSERRRLGRIDYKVMYRASRYGYVIVMPAACCYYYLFVGASLIPALIDMLEDIECKSVVMEEGGGE